MVILDPYGMTFDALVVSGLAFHRIFKFWSTYCGHGGGVCQKSGEIADVVYGWSLCMAMYGWYPNLKLRNYWQNVSHFSLP